MAEDQCIHTLDCSLLSACEYGRSDVLRVLMSKPGLNVNCRYPERDDTPVTRAAYWGHDECVDLLLKDKKTDVTLKDARGRTAIFQAAQYGHVECVKLLLEAPYVDANVIAREEGFTGTPLLFAALRGHAGCVNVLLSHSAVDVSMGSIPNGQEYLLEAALSGGHASCIRALFESPRIDAGAIQRVAEHHCDLFVRLHRPEVVKLLARKASTEWLINQRGLRAKSECLQGELDGRLHWGNCGDATESRVSRRDVVRLLVCASARGFGSMSLL